MAMPAVEDSSAAALSVDDVTTEDEKKAKKPSAAPKSRTASRASTPTRSASTGSKLPKARDRSERAGLPVLQSVGHESMLKDKREKSPGTIAKPGSSRVSPRRSRQPSRVRDTSTASAGSSSRGNRQMDTVAAIEDVSPIVKAIEDSPTTVNEPTQGDQGGVALAQLRAQMEASQFAQQMYHQSEMQRQDNIIQALVEKINFLRQEDEGSTIRIQELERQRDVAQQAMEHMNQVNQSLQSDYTHALRNMDEQMQITRRQDEQVAEHLQQELYVLRSEAATTVVELEERVNSDEFKMAKEYEKLTHELHEQARTNMGLRSKVSETEFSVASANEYLQIVMNEKSAAVAGERMTVMALQEEQYDLRRRLANSEERQEDAMREVREAHQRLQHVEDNARQNLPTMHEELHELRRMLRQQEEANSRMRSEYEMSRQLPHQASVQASSMPVSSRTTENGWDILNGERVVAFPVGSEVRSPELLTPNHRSPVNRENRDGGVFATLQQRSEEATRERFAPRAPHFSFQSTPSECFAPDVPASSSKCVIQTPIERGTDVRDVRDEQLRAEARAERDEQLRELLGDMGMNRRSSSSSTNVQRDEKGREDHANDAAIAKIVEDDIRQADSAAQDIATSSRSVGERLANVQSSSSSSRTDDYDARIRKLEHRFLAQMEEMQREIDQAKEAEQRLRVDRDEWRLMAEDMQARRHDDDEEEEDEEDDENDEPAASGESHPVPSGGSDGGSPGDGPRRRRGDPDPGGGGDDDDDHDDPEITDVKISRREADKVIVPPFPTVTHLDNWMAQCIANVLSACADPSQEEWMR